MRITTTLLSSIAALGSISPVFAAPCTSSSCESFLSIKDGKGVDIYRSYNLDSGSSDVKHLVIVVHGSGRNSYNVFSNVLDAAESLGKLDETLVISPLLKTSDDNPGSNDLYWSSSGWKSGNTSSNSPNVSSFEVIDRIAETVIEGGSFPNLELVTVVGHSAGGQVTQRYAVGNETQNTYSDIKFNYVVMNPSSYMYLDPVRPVQGEIDEFEEPSGCSGYDDYKYGFGDRNAYMNRESAAELVLRYIPRHVTYLVGTEDTSRTNDLDVTCSGDLQGRTRYERGLAYSAYIEEYYPDNNHQVSTVPNVGHSSGSMTKSSRGKAAIFPDPDTIPATNSDSAPTPVPMPPSDLEAS